MTEQAHPAQAVSDDDSLPRLDRVKDFSNASSIAFYGRRGSGGRRQSMPFQVERDDLVHRFGETRRLNDGRIVGERAAEAVDKDDRLARVGVGDFDVEVQAAFQATQRGVGKVAARNVGEQRLARWRTGLGIGDGVDEFAKTRDLDLDLVARNEESRRAATDPDSGCRKSRSMRARQKHDEPLSTHTWSARGENVAGLQGDAARAGLDQGRDVKDQLAGALLLADFAVDAGLERHRLPVEA